MSGDSPNAVDRDFLIVHCLVLARREIALRANPRDQNPDLILLAEQYGYAWNITADEIEKALETNLGDLLCL